MEDQRLAAYKDMLISVAEVVDRDRGALEAMKFKCDHFIKGRERDQIKSCLQLWTSLEKRDYLGVSNTNFIKELLKACMRGNVEPLRLVESYENIFQQGLFNQPAVPPNPHYLQQNTPQIVYVDTGVAGVARPLHQQRQVFGPDLGKEFAVLTQSLGRDWAFFMRELSIPECDIENIKCDYRYTREQIYQCLLVWQDLQKQNATKPRLVSALRAVNRNDLAEKLEGGIY